MTGLKLKMSHVIDRAEKENQEAMINQVIMMEPELSLCLFVRCCSHLTNIPNLPYLVICIWKAV
jgi:hypothetical protein